MKKLKPTALVSINQANGDLAIVGNREGFEYLSESISKLLLNNNGESDDRYTLDPKVTYNLKQIIVGDEAVFYEKEIIEFYNTAKSKAIAQNSRSKKLGASVLKILWFYLLPLLGAWKVMEYLFNA